MESEWVIDAEMSHGDMLCFCPYVCGDIIIGMGVYSTELPSGKLVGVIHGDGNEAADAWYENNKDIVVACTQ